MNQTILVTGSSRGIGRAIALRLARDGYDLVVHGRTAGAPLRAIAAEITALGRAARILTFDIADRAAAAAAIESDIDANGAWYGVVCNAGITRDAVFPALSGDDWDAVLRSNLDGFYNVVHPALMPMIRRRRGGRIVVVTSAAGQEGNRGQVNYSASKAGLIGAAKALALELATRAITVNCVSPGLIATDMTAQMAAEASWLERIPMHRAGRPDDVAAAVAYLVSPAADYVTRQVLAVNGGLC